VIFKALACDYDGTVATHDTLSPEAFAALGRARAAGVRLILVTGRTFFELIRVCEPLDMFDAVVAENGGVLYYPAAGMLRDLAPSPPRRFLAEMDRRGVYYQRGRVIVAAARQDEPAVTAIMVDLGVRLDVVHNRAALMLLPPGISKGAGVRQALRTLGLSFHDVLALGDAENDIDLFEACGWRACPSNAVPELAAQADWVFPGDNGRAVAAAIEGPILSGTLPITRSARHRVALGWAVETFEPVTIPERGVNVLVQGDPLSGKSWLTGALVERIVGRRYSALIIDPEGDYHALAGLPGATRVDMDHPLAMERAIAQFEHDPAACVVVDLSRASHPDKLAQIEVGLRGVRTLRRRVGLPHWVILDEAHYSLHREGVAEDVLALDAKGFYVVTYKASWLRASVIAATDIFVLARTTAPEELSFLGEQLGALGSIGAKIIGVLPDLPLGEFAAVTVEPSGTSSAVTFAAPPRETTHVRHSRKYSDTTMAPAHRFLFREPDGRLVGVAESVVQFRHALAAVGETSLAHHARRGDFSRWILHVFSDWQLAAQLRKVESRWTRGEITDLRSALDRPIALRYGEMPA
jgi:hydroxymethylpyrimidine pyrophosphatase-like HAD family hydrolase